MNSLIAEELTEAIYSPEELRQLHPERIPRHVAIIMDGNRRWAKKRNLPYMAGHWQGLEALKRTVKAAAALGIKTLTVYSFSHDNWKRTKEEVDNLLRLLNSYLVLERESLMQQGVKLDAIGDISRLPQENQDVLNETRALTANNTKIELVLTLSYGARDEICRATKQIVDACLRGDLRKEEISEAVIARHLDTAKWADPDLLIRTSGEMRISNFLLWQISYTELHMTNVLWPDFSESDLLNAVLEFQKRERRWGGGA